MRHLFDLTGKTAIITGSSRGIGRAIAEAMAQHGANVVISSRKADACQAAAAEINGLGAGRAIAIPANISAKEDLVALVAGARAAFGKIDVLVCNAASNPYYGPMDGIADEQFEKILRNNIISSHWLVQQVAPEMRARREGAIIIISSVGGLRGTGVIGAYNISKAADFQLARNLALEFGPDNVTVNCIAPGLIRTDFARALWEDEGNARKVTEHTPLGRIGEPEEIAGAAVFLAAPAGRYVTGQTLIVDGGATAVLPGI
jgi:NAD(P)-dependent dehydrogenase (short-subunit alcohol dehydrogenase family)